MSVESVEGQDFDGAEVKRATSLEGTRSANASLRPPESERFTIQQPEPLPASSRLVFLLDVDNTLLDNDRLKADIATHIEKLVGPETSRVFWSLYEEIRREQDYVDFPSTVARLAAQSHDSEIGRRLQTLLDTLPFADYVYDQVPETLQYLWTLGTVAILSDGDSVFQPLKIRKSGLEAAVHGNVLIYVHKEQQLPEVFRRMPADHYVMVDDKPWILSALERDCPTTFTTVMVLQGKYAVEGSSTPEPDFVIPNIAGLQTLTREQFLMS